MRITLPIFVCFFLLLTSCNKQSDLFKKIDASISGLHFTNEITENDTLNILTHEFVYNGAGVAIGDLNGDGLQDLFFAGNQVNNKLFLNKGNLKFEDITTTANVGKPQPHFWSSGVNFVDLNADGLLDIYVCNTFVKAPNYRKNFLYINQGNNDKGIPQFEEKAALYGVADTSHSSHAQFFDYDNDGDLDIFIGVNWIVDKYPTNFQDHPADGSSPNRDLLLQNNWNDTLQHPVFMDVSLEAGLLHEGYSHSSLIHDINEDGWLDIYVANDYQSDDLIFMNNQDGTFTNQAGKIFKHFSLSAMGSDIADINNDGRMDFYTSEMQPYYNKRKKLFHGPSNYQREILTKKYNYEHQYTRNTLQLNLGLNPETQLPIYADIGMYAQVQETDWSWATLFADYDNDGWQDLFVANGFPKDVTDRDFADFRAHASRLVSQEKLLAAIPAVKSPNFMFKNNGDCTFEDVSKQWGINVPSFSNGAAYGDLDNDGDLDLVVNNIDDPVFLFENTASRQSDQQHYLRIKLKGSAKNLNAYGASVEIFKEHWSQKSYLLSGRGYLSQSENILHFGLGKLGTVDSIKIVWPQGKVQKIGQTTANQVLSIAYPSQNHATIQADTLSANGLFKEVGTMYQLNYQHKEVDFIDFNFQRTLPHKFSQYGPAIAVGDVNGDGLEDVFLSSSRGFEQNWFFQQANGQFKKQSVTYKNHPKLAEEDAGVLLFDADGDTDLDLYIARGSAQYPPNDPTYQDQLMINDGTGNFTVAPTALPRLTANGSCVKAADYDGDGDLDLFVGSRVLPFNYPKPDRSYILRNESTSNTPKFIDATAEVNKELAMLGLITDALWTDFNGDNAPDLIVVGEWMAIQFFKNQKGKLVEITEQSGLNLYKGWWNSLASADLDNDGDMDYIAGNFGENLYFQCNATQPLRVYGKDLDNNGSVDPLISCYWRDSLGNKAEYLYHPLQDVFKQFVGIRNKYNSFAAFGEATASDVFEDMDMSDALILPANWMKTSWIENVGGEKFKLHPLPFAAQLAPVYGILPYDVNGDNYLDLLLVGNDYGMEVQQGRADAFLGLVLLNDGQGNFTALRSEQSHFFIPNDAKGLVQLNLNNQKTLILATQNNDALKVFELTRPTNNTLIKAKKDEVKARFTFKDGSTRIQEFYYGTGFQSQSGRFVIKNEQVKHIQFIK